MEDKYYTESHKKAIDRYDKDFNNTEKNVHNKADSNSKKAYAFAIPAVVIALDVYKRQGVDRPTSGKVYIQGEDIYSLNSDKIAIFRRRQVGLIYQFYNLIPILNVKENITLPCELDGRTPDKSELDELINTLGLKDRVTHLPNELSGGQQQRVSIGRALINHPAILLADEPTGNLDSRSSDEIVELLKLSNQKYKQTIVMITHNLEIAKIADRILRIEDGRLV